MKNIDTQDFRCMLCGRNISEGYNEDCPLFVSKEEASMLSKLFDSDATATLHMCPICRGAGQVSGGFFDRAGNCDSWVSDHALEHCRPCNGTGVVILEKRKG